VKPEGNARGLLHCFLHHLPSHALPTNPSPHQTINQLHLHHPHHVSASRRAKDLIQSNIDILHNTAAVLMEKENIDGDEFQQIILESQAQQYLKKDAPGVTIPYQAA